MLWFVIFIFIHMNVQFSNLKSITKRVNKIKIKMFTLLGGQFHNAAVYANLTKTKELYTIV